MNKATWHENDHFWELSAPLMFSEERMQATARECDLLLELLSLRPAARILDLACGVGRHSVELARRAFAVTGVDRVSSFLEKGRRLAKEAGVDVEFLQADMREFSRPGAFDAVLSLSNSFGTFEDPAEERRTLEKVFSSLVPGGSFILEITGKEVMKRLFRPEDSYGDGVTNCHELRKVVGDWEWVETSLTVTRDGEKAGFVYSYRLYSAPELCSLLESVGFSKTTVFGSLEGSPYDETATRLVVVAEK